MGNREYTQQLLGTAIGDKYEVLRWIGGGGMAGVYLARHRIHGGFTAVKVLADHLASDEGIVEQFLHEARTAANLDGHPNVVRIVDIGENEGLHYLIMQYVEGEDLSTYLKRVGRLTPQETVHVCTQIADGLSWAHARGVIHRDLKPANVRLDLRAQATVLDFGIAKIGSMPTALTQMGVKVGTPFYMAPEHIRGQQIDKRADLYALGVMMYEMAIGQRPFGGESNEAIWHAHVSTPPPVPHEVDPALPQPLSHIISHLLEKDPEKRYQSAEKLIEHLKTLGVTEAPPTLRPQANLNLEELRAEPTTPLTRSSKTSGVRPPATAPPPAPAAPRAEAPPQPAAEPATEPRKRRSLMPVFAGLAGVLAVALGITVYFAMQEEAPPPPPQPEKKLLAELVHSPTGEMILIPAGEFQFGAPNDVGLPIPRPEGFESPNPPQTIQLGNFYMDVTEVSNATYKQFCDAAGRPYPDPPAGDPEYFESKPDYPVVNVTFEDAQAFAQWANKRLPTEQEWEKAARGTDGRIYPWGSSVPQNQANVEGAQDGFDNLAPVNSAPSGSSPYGLLNMSGNVWEWTTTQYLPSPQEMTSLARAFKDIGIPWEPGPPWYVIKGGSYVTPGNDLDLMAFFRASLPSDIKTPYQGFRCAMDAPR